MSTSFRWRTVDIVVTAVVGVVFGVVFFGWGFANGVLTAPLKAVAPLTGVFSGVWFIPAVLAPLIVRKPGAAVVAELLGSLVEMLLGGQYGFATILSGLAQGLAAEIVFAAFRYRSYSLPTALLAGTASGLGCAIVDLTTYYPQFTIGAKLTYAVSCMVGGLVLAGLVSWLLARALGATGVLSALAGGRRQARV
ncbi:ECF transporter S component [Fodinicola acaciae]|uniref:ECF transporter S component n=1 Tax=Fodinicola acaciae TaxID=2681555 RepID=UPI0013D22A8C|nr:ECF transporter S component [Fodinicola acaciae]